MRLCAWSDCWRKRRGSDSLRKEPTGWKVLRGMAEAHTPLGFSPSYDQPVPYMQRTRDYYAALGYPTPYRWASFAAVPFTPLRKALAESCVALVTTAALFDPAKGDQGPGAPYNGAAKFYAVYAAPAETDPDLRISHVAYDRQHTTADDQRSYNPLIALRTAADRGRIGRLAARFYGAPTNRSQLRDHRVRCARHPALLPRRWRGRRGAGAELPGLPPDREPGGSPFGSRRDPDRGHWDVPRTSLSIAACRVFASATSPSAIQPAGRTIRLPRPRRWNSPYRCWEAAAAPRTDRAVAAALERGCVVETRLQRCRAYGASGTGAATRGVRTGKSRPPSRLRE